MTKLYHDEDLWDAMRQKKKLLWCFLTVTAVYLAGFVTLLVLYVLLPYNDPSMKSYVVGVCVLTGVYIIFCFLFLGIPYKRSRHYCRMLKYISVGLKEYTVIPFEEIEDWTTRDGVDVNVAVFRIPNPKREEDLMRQIYVDGEKEFPAFKKGCKAKMILHGNLLIEYELPDTEEAPVSGEENTELKNEQGV